MTLYYSTIDNVKDRCLIDTTITTHDSAMSLCVLEASRHIDEQLRPYYSFRQKLTLTSDYTDCVETDIGKEVMDDEVKIGELLDYNNTSRIWKIKSTVTVAQDSTIKLEDGTGEGIASVASTNDVTQRIHPTFIFNTLPLTTIPTQITYICADYATDLFQARHFPRKHSDVWRDLADLKMAYFINNNFKQGEVKIV